MPEENKKSGGGWLVLAVVAALALLLLDSCGGGSSKPPQPAPVDDDAALMHDVVAIVKPLVDASAGAVTADTAAAHPPAQRSLVDKAMLPLVIISVFGLICFACVVVAVTFFMMRDRQIMTKLEIRKAELRVEYIHSQERIESK